MPFLSVTENVWCFRSEKGKKENRSKKWVYDHHEFLKRQVCLNMIHQFYFILIL